VRAAVELGATAYERASVLRRLLLEEIDALRGS
jgi:hypothetical protein